MQAGGDGLRQNFGSRLVDGIDGIADGGVGREVEAERDRRHLAEVVYGERANLVLEGGNGIQGDELACLGMNVKHSECGRIGLELRSEFHDDFVLIVGRVDG